MTCIADTEQKKMMVPFNQEQKRTNWTNKQKKYWLSEALKKRKGAILQK